MSMQTLTWDVDAAAVAGNSDAYSLASATQARQKPGILFIGRGRGGGGPEEGRIMPGVPLPSLFFT